MALVPRYIPANEVRRVLTWPLVNAAVEEALKATAQTQPDPEHPEQPFARQPPRSVIPTAQGSQLLLTMPGYVANYQLGGSPGSGGEVGNRRSTLACKLVTSFSDNQKLDPPLPNILAHILLFSPQTGRLECIMEATQITAWRTAAASIVATKHLFFRRGSGVHPEPSAITVAIVGCGVQGTSHALGMCATFPVAAIHLWNRTGSKAEALAEQLRSVASDTTRVCVAQTPAEAVATADVVCVATYSAEALVTHSMLKKGSVHINTVGAGQVHFGEVGQDIYDKGRVYVDSWAGARQELKDLKAEIVAEVGEVIRSKNYPDPAGITIFQSMGMAAEDATVAQAVYEALAKADVV